MVSILLTTYIVDICGCAKKKHKTQLKKQNIHKYSHLTGALTLRRKPIKGFFAKHRKMLRIFNNASIVTC